MPAAVAYRRAPLMDPAYVPLGDASVHTAGLQQELTDRALAMVNVERMSALDAVLATKLGGYTQAPAMPDWERTVALLPAQGAQFADAVRAGVMIAAMNRDRQGMLDALKATEVFARVLLQMHELQTLEIGADMLRVALDLYRRTKQPWLLDLVKSISWRIPGVDYMMHNFPYKTEYQPEIGLPVPDELIDPIKIENYIRRMERLANGKLMADSVAMTALLSQYSGSARFATAAKTGLNALKRYHGMPSGAFSADPFLAGRDPARAADLEAVCAQAEAWLDALCAHGDMVMADQLEMLLVNVLPDLLTERGLRVLSPINRLADDDSCTVSTPAQSEVSALLRALYAVRRAVWMSTDDHTLAYMLPVSGGCVTRLGGTHVRLTAETKGIYKQEIAIRFECREPVSCTLKLRIPGYADSASVHVNNEKPKPAATGEMAEVRRTFVNGDLITICLELSPRVETGYRGSASIFVGAKLMALSLPKTEFEWRYALLRSATVSGVEEKGLPYVLVAACEAPEWQQKNGFIQPPPQGVPMDAAYELTLIPFAGTTGRIAAFPCVQER